VYRANEDWQNAAKAYEAMANKRPKDAYARFYAGRCWAGANNPDKAIVWLKEVWAMNQRKDMTAYGLSRCYALKKDKEQTLLWIRNALEAGFDEKEAFKEDPVFDFLKDDAGFKELMKK
jgi:tetratricopeptide (TPR) repeat protein